MQKKIFISYSHKDESYKEELDEHLTLLKRNDFVSTWNDRKIVGSDQWKDKIDENLEDADIVLLLISSSFIASEYCYDVEMTKAIANHQSGKSIVIPIIVRSCDWKDSPFAKFQALPTDAKAVSKWRDADDAWLDVVEGIKKVLNKPSNTPVSIESKIEGDCEISITKENQEWINDTEITLNHRKLSNVGLSDIYVVPDMKVEANGDEDKKINIVESSKIVSDAGRYLITGEDQQGKTSLLKYVYKEFLKEEKVPLYIDLTAVNKSDLTRLIKKALANQYETLSYDDFMALSTKVLLLDNLDHMKLNMKYQDSFLEQINNSFTEVVLTCHNSYYYVAIELKHLREFFSVELVSFGHVRREEMVKKWVALGIEEEISDSELYEKTSDLKEQLDIVIKKNIVPAKPVYILMLLQMFEAYSKQNLELTSYGHCYQQLIYQSFEKANIDGRDFEKYLNVITELSWKLFENKRGLNQIEVNSFFTEYTKEYLFVDKNLIVGQLIKHSILVERDDRLHFKYPYIYYFFVGKKIADNYAGDESIRSRMDEILLQLHREDYANIIIFITHHTKDAWILNKIDDVLSSLFDENQPATLESDQLHYMREFIESIPSIVIEQREIEKERKRHNQNKDLLDQSRLEVQQDEGEPLDLLANINTTFKGMEIVGQIIRNRHASLKRDTLYSLAKTGAASGLRFLEYFINISESSQNEIIQLVSERVIDSPYISDTELKQQAESLYMQLSFGVINAVIRKISSSIGSKEAKEIYSKLESKNDSSAYKLLRIAIGLQFSGKLKPNEIDAAASEFKNNPVCMRILRELVVQHIYMFPIGYKAKQQISESLGISLKQQRIMDLKKIAKA